MSERRPYLVTVVSDLHCGSTVGLCPPEGVRLDDGGRYRPSRVQRWLWERFTMFCERARELRARHKPRKTVLVFNGDVFEGDHHDTTQIVSANPEAEGWIASRAAADLRAAVGPDAVIVIRGTEAHVGPAGASEEAFARGQRAVKDHDADTWSWYRWRFSAYDKVLDFAHHGRGGMRPWTQGSAVALLARHIEAEHDDAGERPPDVAVRSHTHRYADSGPMGRTRVVVTPAFQLKTGFGWRIGTETIADVGGVVLLVRPDEPVEVVPLKWKPKLTRLWTFQ